jgi:hypothetical protein
LLTDAGGTRGVSQLKILAELMHRLNFEAEDDEVLLPCDAFDMIGGSGSGGWVEETRRRMIHLWYRHRFIAILLVVFGLNAEQALDEFVELSVDILEKQEMDAAARTAALKIYINKLLDKYGIGIEARLLHTEACSKGPKMCVIF